jgi:hypothetical protein
MSEKPEADEYDAEDDDLDVDSDDVDLERATKDLELARRRAVKSGMPALRRLELLAEQKLTAELTSDFEDYDIDEPVHRQRRAQRG